MRLSHAWKFGVLLVLVTASFAALSQVPELSSLLKMEGIDSSYTVTYRDDHGNAMTKEAFSAEMAKKRSFNLEHNALAHTASLILLAKDAKVDAPVIYKVRPGQPFPPFRLKTVSGATVDNVSLHGRPTILNFFFAECVGCITETPALNAYASQHPEIRVLAVTFDDAKTAATYVAQRHFAWPVAYGGQSLDDALGVNAYPAMALLGADGRLLDIRLSALMHTAGDSVSAQDVNRWVQRTLAQHDRDRKSVV